MIKLYLFNPDSDLALANNDENYMAPLAARQIRNDLAFLPVWYADANSYVLAQSHPNQSYLKNVSSIFHLPVQIITYPEVSGFSQIEVSPWGWNKALRKELLQLGVNNYNLPSDQDLCKRRALSNRECAATLLRLLSQHKDSLGEAYVLKTKEDFEEFQELYSAFLLKSPISGSGKGLKWCRDGGDEVTNKWFNRVLQSMGSVVAEPIYNKVEDLAMEFIIQSDTEVEFIGYSSFNTNENGAYTGNQLVSDVEFEALIENKYFYSGFLKEKRVTLESYLLEVYSDYRGVLGVDMMVCATGTHSYALHPCVEVNLRMNMGVVAHTFYKRFVQRGKKGIYKIDYAKKKGVSFKRHQSLKNKYPLITQDGKIIKGYLALCPVTEQSQYHAWVLIE